MKVLSRNKLSNSSIIDNIIKCLIHNANNKEELSIVNGFVFDLKEEKILFDHKIYDRANPFFHLNQKYCFEYLDRIHNFSHQEFNLKGYLSDPFEYYLNIKNQETLFNYYFDYLFFSEGELLHFFKGKMDLLIFNNINKWSEKDILDFSQIINNILLNKINYLTDLNKRLIIAIEQKKKDYIIEQYIINILNFVLVNNIDYSCQFINIDLILNKAVEMSFNKVDLYTLKKYIYFINTVLYGTDFQERLLEQFDKNSDLYFLLSNNLLKKEFNTEENYFDNKYPRELKDSAKISIMKDLYQKDYFYKKIEFSIKNEFYDYILKKGTDINLKDFFEVNILFENLFTKETLIDFLKQVLKQNKEYNLELDFKYILYKLFGFKLQKNTNCYSLLNDEPIIRPIDFDQEVEDLLLDLSVTKIMLHSTSKFNQSIINCKKRFTKIYFCVNPLRYSPTEKGKYYGLVNISINNELATLAQKEGIDLFDETFFKSLIQNYYFYS